jgi:predicted aspartyl protease
MIKKHKIPIFAIELSLMSYHIATYVKVGKRKLRMIIDTGASQTLISSKLAEKLELETSLPELDNITVGIGEGSLTPQFTSLPSCKIGDIQIKNLTCLVLPMDHINQTYKTIGQKPIDGIIGNDILLLLKSMIDLKTMTITARVKENPIDFMQSALSQFSL